MNPKQFEKLKSLSNMVKDVRCDCKPYGDIHGCDWFSNYRQLEMGMAARAPEIFAEIETLRAKLVKISPCPVCSFNPNESFNIVPLEHAERMELVGLRAKLVKAEKVIETVDLLAGKSSGWRTRALRHLPEDWIAAMELIDSSLKEYRGETK